MDSQENDLFKNGNSYNNVYFLKIDASGHSNIVLNNPIDLTNKLFDLFEDTVYAIINENKKLFGCKYAEFWGWQGDGGLCVIYDDQESIAIKTCLTSVLNILGSKLIHLREQLNNLSIKGELHVRISVHKGSFDYKGHDRQGSIHSKDLNFVAHLEQVTPRDSVTISQDVYRACVPEVQSKFTELDFKFEDHIIYFYTIDNMKYGLYEWLNNVNVSNAAKTNIIPRRFSEFEKSTIIKNAEREIIDLGTSLSTCSYYLVSTQRPTPYKDAVLTALDKGINYICLALNPNSDITKFYGKDRGEKLKNKINESINKLSVFGNQVKGKKGTFKLYLFSRLPYFASIILDKEENGLAIFSPYMPCYPDMKTERADCPHFVISKKQNNAFFSQIKGTADFILKDANTVEIKF